MGKRDTNIAEANLPGTPVPEKYIAMLKAWLQKDRSGVATNDPIHGNAFANVKVEKKKGTLSTEKAGVQCALAFAQLCDDKGAQYPSLQEWATSWAKWVIKAEHLCDNGDDAQGIKEQRQATAANGRYKLYNLPIESFKTYMNATGRVYTEQSGKGLVMSSRKQLPEFQTFVELVVERARKVRARRDVEHPVPDVVSEKEYTELMDWPTKSVAEQQRQNIIAVAYCTGLRPIRFSWREHDFHA